MTTDLLFARLAARALTFSLFATILYASLCMAPVRAAHPEITALHAHSILASIKRNHGEADSMLAALRDDVFKAVILGARGDADYIREVTKEFAERVRKLRARVEANGELGMDENLRSGLQALHEPLDACIRSAEDLIALAGDRATPASKLDSFQEIFDVLDNAMNAFGDQIDAQVGKSKQDVVQDAHFARPAVAGITLLGMALLSIVGLGAYRNNAGKTRHPQRAADATRAAGPASSLNLTPASRM